MEFFALKVGVGHSKPVWGQQSSSSLWPFSGHSHLSFLFHVDQDKMARPTLALKSPKRYGPSVLGTFNMASSKAP